MQSPEEIKRRTMYGLLAIAFGVAIPLALCVMIAAGELENGPIAVSLIGLSMVVSLGLWLRS